jgi:hypothetical protein
LWFALLLFAGKVWERSPMVPPRDLWTRGYLVQMGGETAKSWYAAYNTVSILDRLSGSAGVLVLLGAALLLPFFVLLPFGARPGRNRACVRHVARSVLLGTGAIHLWGVSLVGVLLLLARNARVVDSMRVVSFTLLTMTAVALWVLIALVQVVRRDYRRPADLPEPHEPWCDDCGYNLIAADAEGRCPECGRPVAASLGARTRPPTPWEKRPSPLNFAVIGEQLRLLVRQPRHLFFRMPTLTGQRAAQRWLVLSMIVIALLAACIVPAIAALFEGNQYFDIFAGAVAMGFAWMIFAGMMVGIETAGIATFSRMRSRQYGIGRGVYLAASAKVTAYSSILMVLWVVLGGIQLTWAVAWLSQSHMIGYHAIRTQQIILAGSLGVAHIGGLLWYELTVYRGIRAIQYANR